jgi:hypothetical protein
MTEPFYDRLTGTSQECLPQEPLAGRWRVRDDARPVLLNSFPVSEGAYLVPDQEFRWTVSGGSASAPLAGEFDRREYPGELVASALCEIGELLRVAQDDGGTWTHWLLSSPVYAKLSDRIQRQPLDADIVTHLPHLREVCRRPRMQLEVTVERVRTEQARRMPPRATEYLASHTEDWEELRINSVRPRRVLSVLADDQLDIYENRVVARLVDHLLDYLNDRIEDVRQLRHVLQEVVSYDDPASEATHWIRHRIYEIWGKASEAEQGRRRAEHTLDFLENLRREVASLLDSVLYRAIPRRAHVASSLRATNILVNDQHYRHVAALWQRWSRSRAARATTPRELFDLRQRLCLGFDAFVTLTVCLALDGLGFRSRDDRGPSRGGPAVELEGSGAALLLTWREDGTLRLDRTSGTAPLHLVPLASALSARSDLERMRLRVSELASGGAGPPAAPTGTPPARAADGPQADPVFRIVLYPGSAQERAALPPDLGRLLDTPGTDHLPSEERVARLLPVSPLSVHSLERVARAIRWWLLDGLYTGYPAPEVPFPARAQHYGSIPGVWLAPSAGGRALRVRRPPSEAEKTQWADWLAATRRQVLREGRRAQVTAEQITDLEQNVERAILALEPLTHCPLRLPCQGAERFEPRPDRDGEFTLFFACCAHATWELRQCEFCKERYPVLLPRSFRPREVCRRPGWVDHLLGRDVLAVPCWGRHGAGDFICPRCGRCKNAGRFQEGGCLRCWPENASCQGERT